MTEKKTGGPAFPKVERIVGVDYSEGAYDNFTVETIEGMTLRDYFAGQALKHVTADFESAEELAKHLYYIADAMIQERTK